MKLGDCYQKEISYTQQEMMTDKLVLSGKATVIDKQQF